MRAERLEQFNKGNGGGESDHQGVPKSGEGVKLKLGSQEWLDNIRRGVGARTSDQVPKPKGGIFNGY